MIINHNVPALNTYNKLNANNQATSKSLEKLSSGLRINRAGDDAAGLAISEKMRGQIRGLDMAGKNAQDSISLIQTAEGALTETHSILQRMRELAVQSSNDTNTDSDRKQLQAEITASITEIDRIGNTTEFNTKKLIDGSAKGVAAAVSGSYRVNNNSALTFDPLNTTGMASLTTAMGLGASSVANGAYMIVRVADTDTTSGGFTAADWTIVGPGATQMTVASAGAAGMTLSSDAVTFGAAMIGTGMASVTVSLTTMDANVAVGQSATFVFSKFQAATSNLGNSVMTQIGANAGQTAFISMSDMRAAALNVDKIDISTKFGAQTAIETVQNAMDLVSTQRANMGAIQNRLEHTINNLSSASENITAAESRIRDVDMAKEMMSFQKNNILNQAATAMLAQANQQPQGVLQLLR
ncbi:flagellin [Azotosporobacter soli]|uniref:flagellin N-terminal helical domain-containing protein n=1 Tax=Azotosporobacter soli TaxID=3055040 RepID=UPI0031FE6643